MPESTPAPKRSRKKAAAPEEVGLIGVMAAADPENTAAAAPSSSDEMTPATAEPVLAADEATLRLERAGIAEATAGKVEVRMGGIGALGAEDVFVEWGGVGAVRAERLSVEFGGVGAVLAGEARVTQGIAGSIAAREVILEQGIVRTMFAQHVTIKRPSAVVVMIAQHVTGEVRPLLDWRGALAFGAAFGLVTAIAKAIRKER